MEDLPDNLCICEKETKTLTKEETSGLVEFLNRNMNDLLRHSIEASYFGSERESAVSTCKKLHLVAAPQTDFTKAESSACVKAITGFVQQYDFEYEKNVVIYFVSVERTCNTISGSQFKLKKFQRIDTYSRFRKCQPRHFPNPQLCLCS